MRRSRVIIFSIVAAVIITVIVILSFIYSSSHTTSSVATRTNADYVTAITSAVPGLLDNNNQPIFTVDSVTKLADNWYRVVIKSNQNGDTLRALIFDSTVSTDTVSLVLGPSVSFDRSEIPKSVSLPDDIYREFVR